MNTFCVLPWYSSELPGHSPCCLLPIGTDIKRLKLDLINEVKSTACTKCWTIEAQGQKSRRQFENEFLDYKLDRDLINLKQDCVDSKHETLLYQLTTSNLCNQACVSCDSNSSSKWAEIEKKMGHISGPKKEINLENSNINYSTAKRISFLGGEPFFDPKTFEILQKLLDHNNPDCFITLVTNGSILLDQQKINFLSNFSDFNLCISIDGIGSIFEYMRWPGKWSTLTNNIEQYRAITSNLSVSYTISSLNALYYDETVQWFESNNLRYNHNMVTYPRWLSLTNAPVEIKKNLLKKKNFISDLLSITNSEISLNEYVKKIKSQDLAKKINYEDYLPEIFNIVNNQ